jgi:hypothetical protein
MGGDDDVRFVLDSHVIPGHTDYYVKTGILFLIEPFHSSGNNLFLN